MHILYVYREYKNRRKRYGDEMIRQGHKVTFICLKDKKTPNQIGKNKIKKYKPDLIWFLNPAFVYNNVISKEAMDYSKQKGIPSVVYGTFNTQIDYTEMDKVWKTFDFFFAHHIDFYNYLKKINVNAYYMPVGFYPNQYQPLRVNKTIQISFAGNTQTTVRPENDRRVQYLKALKDFKVKIYGKAFNARGLVATHYDSHAQQRNLYSKSKINLDLPFINSSLEFYRDKYHLKNRFFEIPATNNFLMIAKCDEFIEILDETMVGYFDGSKESMIETASKYLKDKKVREKMTRRAHKEVINNHTFSHRFKKMFNIIGDI